MRYEVPIEQGSTSFGASVPDLPGCIAVASTRAEVEKLIQDAISAHIALLREAGETVPGPTSHWAVVEVETA